jgi:hypothetical protein
LFQGSFVEDSVEFGGAVYVELWVSLASLLRSYMAAHGLNGNRQATVELGETRIVVRHGERWLELEREGAQVRWSRENGSVGTLEMTEAGRLRSCSPTLSTKDVERMGHPESSSPMSQNRDMGHPGSGGDEREMDVMAEEWARELMQ